MTRTRQQTILNIAVQLGLLNKYEWQTHPNLSQLKKQDRLIARSKSIIEIIEHNLEDYKWKIEE